MGTAGQIPCLKGEVKQKTSIYRSIAFLLPVLPTQVLSLSKMSLDLLWFPCFPT